MDLYTITPGEIASLMNQTDDPEILRSLIMLEEAAITGDEELRTEAIAGLSDTLLLERGMYE
jgi:hypothetical protein